MDAVRKILAFNAGRDPERLQLKYRLMRRSAFAFLRGSCHLFYQQLPHTSLFNSAPLSWSCGDLHLENFGSYKGDNRLVYFDINDFDEAALAPASWDLLRLLSSVRVAAADMGLRAADSGSLCSVFLKAYAASLAQGKAYWVQRETAQGLVRDLLDGLDQRRRAEFLDTRSVVIGKKRQLLVDGKKALPASQAQRERVCAFMAGFAGTQIDPDFYQVLDVARRIAGTGSLGVERFAILLRGNGHPDGNYLLDLRQALPSALAPQLKAAQPEWQTQAHRIVATQYRMQAVTMAFLHPVLMDGEHYVLRALQPSEDRVSGHQRGQSMADWTPLLQTLGRILAWAQLRSAGREGSAIADELMDFGHDTAWHEPLLAASQDAAQRVLQDAAAFHAAFDAGALEWAR